MPRTNPISAQSNPSGSIITLSHNGVPLALEFSNRLSQANLTQLDQVMIEVLNYGYTLPQNKPTNKIEVADRLFESLFAGYQNNFGLSNPKHLTFFWYYVLQTVKKWETNHKRIHKGTLYFWLGALGTRGRKFCIFRFLQRH